MEPRRGRFGREYERPCTCGCEDACEAALTSSCQSMDPVTYIRERQTFWARRRGISLGGPFRNSPDPAQRERGAKVWAYELETNLYRRISTTARAAFEDGDGGELHASRP